MDKLQISLAAARVNAGKTQSDVAKEMHISKQTLGNWEKGKVIPRFAQLVMLCNLYGIDQENILLPEKST